jgi:hypothetical protein
MHDYLAPLEIWRQHHEELLAEAENARLAKEIRCGRKEASREWRISLGGWILRLQRIAEYEARPALKSWKS